MLKEKLKIVLITYNRKEKLRRTLIQLLDDNSPVKDFDITVLDNASDDGTSELIEEYKKKFPNIEHIKHPNNIGGNANICRAYELGANCQKEYVWVLCDDDVYDFSNWKEVENAIENKCDIICVADYFFPTEKDKNNLSYQIPQLTFVPAGIYKTSNITSDVIINMHDSIITGFPQSVLSIKVVNEGKKIYVLTKPVVFNGLHFEEVDMEGISYTRGMTEKNVLSQKENFTWILGYVEVTTLLKDKKLRKNSIEKSILYKDIYGSWRKFFYAVYEKYFRYSGFEYFFEIYKALHFTKKFRLLFRVLLIYPFIYIHRRENGIYIRLFNVIKTKLIPFKKKEN